MTLSPFSLVLSNSIIFERLIILYNLSILLIYQMISSLNSNLKSLMLLLKKHWMKFLLGENLILNDG